ncbi:MAG: ribbon-helix-helix protein, CopG family [Candidatus Aminicenantes bacterium]|nr:ribbon-helix-helix protein, CopG family [Candidatus Aminicenantes bacterium]
MVIGMKTTLNVDDSVLAALKKEAILRGWTMSELLEAALRAFLAPRAKAEEWPSFPSLRSGGPLVDIADREALYEAAFRSSNPSTRRREPGRFPFLARAVPRLTGKEKN